MKEPIREQLRKIIVSPGFVHSDRLRRFLTYCVEQTLAGTPETLKEYAIALEAFDRPKHFNPAEDPIVRVEARRLRKKLEEYYATDGVNDLVLIEIPKGSYVPSFRMRPKFQLNRVWIYAAGVCLFMIAAAALWIPRGRASLPSGSLRRLTTDAGLTKDASLNSDATLLVYASDRSPTGGLDVWIKKLPSGQQLRLTDDAADDHQPVLSPDGRSVAFRSERQPTGIYVVPAIGGAVTAMAPDGRDPRFSPDGNQLVYWIGSPGDDFLPPAGKVYRIPATGGAAQPFQNDMMSAACPIWSPGGDRILFLGIAGQDGLPDWWTASPDSGKAVSTGARQILEEAGLSISYRDCSVTWQENGIIFSAHGGDVENLWKLAINEEGKASGKPERLTFGPGQEERPSVANGMTVFSTRNAHSRIWSLAVRGDAKPQPLTEDSATSSFPSVSRDGTKIAYLSDASGSPQLHWKDLKTSKDVALTEPPAQPRYPQISPDGRRVLYTDYQKTPLKTMIVSPKGDAPREICKECARVWDWSGNMPLFQKQGERRTVYGWDLESGEAHELVTLPDADIGGPRLSPDLRSVAFHAIPNAIQRQLMLVPVDGSSAAVSLLEENHSERNCTWGVDGKTLYFLSDRDGHRCIWSRRADGSLSAVLHLHSARLSLAAFGDVGAIGLSAAADRLIFAMSEVTSNLWMISPVSGQVRKQ